MSNSGILIAVVIGLAFISLSIYLSISNFMECRNFGFSLLYCLTVK